MNLGTLAVIVGFSSAIVAYALTYFLIKPKGKRWYMWLVWLIAAQFMSRFLNHAMSSGIISVLT